MVFQVSTFIDILNSALCAYLAVRLHRAYRQDPASKTLRNFFFTYVALTVAFLFLFIPRTVAAQHQLFLSVAFALGSFSFLVAGSFFGRIVLQFTRPTWVKHFSTMYQGVAVACLAWSFFDRALPVVDPTTGITQWNVPLGVGILGGSMLLLVLIPGAVLFFSRGVRTRDNHVVRVRSFTIGIGTFLLTLTALTFYLATTEMQAIIGDLLSIGALLTIFLGVIYHRPPVLAAVVQPPPST